MLNNSIFSHFKCIVDFLYHTNCIKPSHYQYILASVMQYIF